jgi:RNA-directed DNA polymerase
MKALINDAIQHECAKLIKRQFEYLALLDSDTKRKAKRLDQAIQKIVLIPSYWAIDKRFNPFVVSKKAAYYAANFHKKILANEYVVNTSLQHKVSKSDGSDRIVSIFQVPDAALSRHVYKSLLQKNYARFSGYAYAYREDKISYDAIKEISTDWQGKSRIYTAEFDFSKFFDKIKHDYIWHIFDRYGFVATPQERFIIKAFLSSRSSNDLEYSFDGGTKRDIGIPQGTSISLFLANLVCFELDRSFERLGVGFARYADDTIVWSPSYAKIVEAFEAIDKYGDAMGVPLNLEKSQGIHLLKLPSLRGEISAKTSIDFLGHQISLTETSIKDVHVNRIKCKISFLIYQYLLQAPKKGIFNTKRLLPNIDLDYVVAVMQVRRYLYGGLTTKKLMAFMRGAHQSIKFKGLMSFYPLVNNKKQLSDLDGWLIHAFRNALNARQELWKANGTPFLPGQSTAWISEIESAGEVVICGMKLDLQLPSFRLINDAITIAIERRGLHDFQVSKTGYYD